MVIFLVALLALLIVVRHFLPVNGRTTPQTMVAKSQGWTALSEHIAKQQPVVLCGSAKSWKAYKEWNFEYFANKAGDKQVILEVGNVLQYETINKKVLLSEYLSNIGAMDASSGYLSVLDIFALIPSTKSDVNFSAFEQCKQNCFFGSRQRIRAWIGPKGTITGFHRDWADNIICQVRGKKRLVLVPPHLSHVMLISSKFDVFSELSMIDYKKYELHSDMYPEFAAVKDQAVEIILEEGDAAFIPYGWWHFVESLSPSISVNCFMYSPMEVLWYYLPEVAKMKLHNWGLYKSRSSRGCTCHSRCAEEYPIYFS